MALIEGDIRAVGRIENLMIAEGAEVEIVEVVLAEIEQ